MRELKFRAWDANTFPNGGSMHYGGFSIHATGKVEYLTYFVHEGSPVMQYTGLKDCDGKEIYECDILSLEDCYGQKWPNSEVLYSEIWSGFGVTDGGAWYRLVDFQNIKVIGNIYENPELIK